MAKHTKREEYHYTLTVHDMKRLLDGGVLIAEEDGLAPFAAIKVKRAWTRMAIRASMKLARVFPEEDFAHLPEWVMKRRRAGGKR